MELNFHVPRSVNPGTAGGVGHSTDNLIAQLKRNHELSYFQEQLWPESLGSFCWAALALAADSSVSLRVKERSLIIASLALSPSQESGDLLREVNFES